jgi:hypothetical protein
MGRRFSAAVPIQGRDIADRIDENTHDEPP